MSNFFDKLFGLEQKVEFNIPPPPPPPPPPNPLEVSVFESMYNDNSTPTNS